MYGSVAKLHVKPEQGEELARYYDSLEPPPGATHLMLYRLDANPDEYMVVVAFASEEAYRTNAQRPAQMERFRRIRSFLDADPEWNDGEIVTAVTVGPA
jgi:quinol monooxygenase YgiN